MQNLSKLNNRIKGFTKLDYRYKWLCIYIYFYSGIIRFYILVFKFKSLQPNIGKKGKVSNFEINDPTTLQYITTVAHLVCIVSNFTLWDSKCLVKAIVAQNILKKKNIWSTLYLGVKKGNNYELAAHAWLTVGHIIVTGAAEKDEFTTVSYFTNDPNV